jgi:hypothetical protein
VRHDMEGIEKICPFCKKDICTPVDLYSISNTGYCTDCVNLALDRLAWVKEAPNPKWEPDEDLYDDKETST